jgi:hypothetical protein
MASDYARLEWLGKYNSRLQDVYWRIENESGTVRDAIDFFLGIEEREREEARKKICPTYTDHVWATEESVIFCTKCGKLYFRGHEE